MLWPGPPMANSSSSRFCSMSSLGESETRLTRPSMSTLFGIDSLPHNLFSRLAQRSNSDGKAKALKVADSILILSPMTILRTEMITTPSIWSAPISGQPLGFDNCNGCAYSITLHPEDKSCVHRGAV